METIKHRTVTANGIRQHYIDAGQYSAGHGTCSKDESPLVIQSSHFPLKPNSRRGFGN
jgi:hypothetical protein